MEVDPVFVPFQRAVYDALVDQKSQARGTKVRHFASEKLSQYRQFSSAQLEAIGYRGKTGMARKPSAFSYYLYEC